MTITEKNDNHREKLQEQRQMSDTKTKERPDKLSKLSCHEDVLIGKGDTTCFFHLLINNMLVMMVIMLMRIILLVVMIIISTISIPHHQFDQFQYDG